MIKKQYHEWVANKETCYFHNCLDSTTSDNELKSILKEYKATIGKSKYRKHVFNIKWHDPKLYTLFVLRWS